MTLTAGTRLGVYEVVSPLGEGGMVRPDGTVKVLDFGLAKALDSGGLVNSDDPPDWRGGLRYV